MSFVEHRLKLRVHPGNGEQTGNLPQVLSAAETQRLLFQTIACCQAYVSFAMLPLLQQSQQQLRSLYLFPGLRFQPKQPFSIQAPSFAARPLYTSKMRKVCVSVAAFSSPKSSELPVMSARDSLAVEKRPAASAHPLYSYAALQQPPSAPPAVMPCRQSTACLHTYAVLAVPTTKQQPQSHFHSLRGTLRDFAQLSPHSGVVKTSHDRRSAVAGRSALQHYAQLRGRT